jgi:hypothetical protein
VNKSSLTIQQLGANTSTECSVIEPSLNLSSKHVSLNHRKFEPTSVLPVTLVQIRATLAQEFLLDTQSLLELIIHVRVVPQPSYG